MGYRGGADAVAAACAWPVDRAPVRLSHGWRDVRDPDGLCEGRRHVQRRCRGVDDECPASLQAAYPARLHDFPDLTFHTHDPHLERRGGAVLSGSALSDRAYAE